MSGASRNYWPDSKCAKAFWHQHELPTYKELLEYVYVENMSIPDAAERAGMARSSGYKIHFRALQQLRDFLREHGVKSLLRQTAD